MAIAALVLWMCTAAAGAYLLATGTRVHAPRQPDAGVPESGVTAATVAAEVASAAVARAPAAPPGTAPPGTAPPGTVPPGTGGAPGTTTAKARRDKDRFDPPSLTRAKNEPLPGLRALAEFAHPALAIIGLGFWLAYVLSRDRLFLAIGLGVLLGAICAGITWVTSNGRAARRFAAQPEGDGDSTHPSASTSSALSFPPRLLLLHALGAAVTLLLTALIAARA